MKIVIGIVLIALVIMGLAAYLVLMLNAREMIFCGDVKNDSGTATAVTGFIPLTCPPTKRCPRSSSR